MLDSIGVTLLGQRLEVAIRTDQIASVQVDQTHIRGAGVGGTGGIVHTSRLMGLSPTSYPEQHRRRTTLCPELEIVFAATA